MVRTCGCQSFTAFLRELQYLHDSHAKRTGLRGTREASLPRWELVVRSFKKAESG